MTEKDKNYKNETHCYICEEEFKGDKVLDHNHLTGNYRGAAHNECNLNYKITKHIPVIFQILAGYDAHIFIKMLGVASGKIDCIPNNEEKYISFKKEIVVDTHTNKEGKSYNIKREIRFIDSFKFMLLSLDNLVCNLSKDQFRNMNMFYKGKKLNLLLRKGGYPYDNVKSLEKLNETCLHDKKNM